MSHRSNRPAMRVRIFNAISIATALVCWHSVAPAQTLYRCGNVYQDQPCPGTQKEKRIGVTSSPAGASASNADASCTQRGADALKIVWRREAGMTLEQANGQAGSSSEKALVEEVYRVRGSAPEVRARIESECMAEKERRERYAAASPSNGLTGMPTPGVATPGVATPGVSTPGVATPATLVPTAPAAPTQKPEANAAGMPVVSLGDERKPAKANPECQRLAAKVESVKAQQRAGGDAKRMEQLRTELNNHERMFRQQGCS